MAFIACYAAVGICHVGDTCSFPDLSGLIVNVDSVSRSEIPLDVLDARITEECYLLASVALLECSLKSHRASDIACAIVFYVRKSLCVVPVWNRELTALTRNDMRSDEMKNIFHMLENLLPPVEWIAEKREKKEEEKDTASECNQRQPHIIATPTQSQAPTSAHQHSTEADRHSQTQTRSNDDEDDEDEERSQYLSAALLPLQLTTTSTSSPPMGPIPTEYPISLEHRTYLPEVHTPLDNKENCRDKDREDGAHVRPSPTSVVAMDSLVGV